MILINSNSKTQKQLPIQIPGPGNKGTSFAMGRLWGIPSLRLAKTPLIGALALSSLRSVGAQATIQADNPVDATGTPIPNCDRIDLWPEYARTINETLYSCSATRNFADRATLAAYANGKLPWKIKIVSENDIPFPAQAHFAKGEIQIRCANLHPVSNAAFELTNFIQQEKFIQAYLNANKGYIDRDDFAEMYEKIERDGCNMHIDAMEICIKEKSWGSRVQFWKKKRWEDVRDYRLSTPHAENYRKEYDKGWTLRLIYSPIRLAYYAWTAVFGRSKDHQEL